MTASRHSSSTGLQPEVREFLRLVCGVISRAKSQVGVSVDGVLPEYQRTSLILRQWISSDPAGIT